MSAAIQPSPTPEEAAAILAVLALSQSDAASQPAERRPSRWVRSGRNYEWPAP